ncbi:hypothetical protein D049_1518B, partial [Vibrio parahaemolyticus VPTS-2010]
HQ